jgi:ribonuclease HI
MNENLKNVVEENTEDKVIIYTDGASSGNPGPGGWAAVVRKGESVKEVGGSEEKTTNNRMEMSAAIGGLSATETGDEINLYTDSQYLINGITKWVFGWIKNDWQTKEKKDVLNKDLWQSLHELTKNRKINWVAVSGHAGVALNNRVDEIAVSFSKSIKGEDSEPILFEGSSVEYKTEHNLEVKEPTKEEMESKKTKSNSRKGKKAFSYLSMVDGQVQKHTTWDDCKTRVSGKAGAKFRKSISKEDEDSVVKEWTS